MFALMKDGGAIRRGRILFAMVMTLSLLTSCSYGERATESSTSPGNEAEAAESSPPPAQRYFQWTVNPNVAIPPRSYEVVRAAIESATIYGGMSWGGFPGYEESFLGGIPKSADDPRIVDGLISNGFRKNYYESLPNYPWSFKELIYQYEERGDTISASGCNISYGSLLPLDGTNVRPPARALVFSLEFKVDDLSDAGASALTPEDHGQPLPRSVTWRPKINVFRDHHITRFTLDSIDHTPNLGPVCREFTAATIGNDGHWSSDFRYEPSQAEFERERANLHSSPRWIPN
ncbi:MAG: hypothetical protein WBA38_03935 [Gordonia sp. (in: high G+C Gram-positive bacteria)]|uniref:hypothetical protein n=1 Tax=Gordonia sp. (in: high G+C Gram-positive bacteria) TaxID=84139 RepID=UPI003C756686